MKKLLLSVIVAVLPILAYSQAAPQHEKYVKIGSDSITWGDAYKAWEPGRALYQGLDPEAEENENFNISRIKPRKRFINSFTQVRIEQSPDRKLLWWCPIGGDGWNALPSYYFGGEVWSMWSYTDIWGNWTAPLMSMPAAMLDVCHKNGVQISCLAPVAFGASLYPDDEAGYGYLMNKILADEGGHHKFLKFLKYYGIDGFGFNSEFNWRGSMTAGNYSGQDFHTALKKFLGDCYTTADQYEVPFHNCWYSLTGNDGTMGGSGMLNTNNKDWFDYEGKPTSTAYFTNYYSPPLSSQKIVEQYFPNRSSYDVYMGVDYQAGYGLQTWLSLINCKISLGLWGAHNRNMLYEQRGENGSSPMAMQETYQQLLENVFTGSTRNPVNPPPISEQTKFASKEDGAYGWAQYIVAKSTLTPQDGGDLSTDPFVTYFNLGNGMFFNVAGERQSDVEWYNIGMQDYMPTWRWWFTNTYMGRTAETVSPDLKAEFTWDDAWFGGSCLEISGATDVTYAQLFKTKYPTSRSGDYLTITYKVLSGEGSLSWACSKEGEETQAVEKVIKNSLASTGKWETVSTAIGGRSGIALQSSTIAQIGLKFTNTSDDFKILIGQVALTNGKIGSAEIPQQPIVEKTRMMARTYKGVDAKIIFNMPYDGEEKEAYEPVYNADVDTWFYKIYIEQEGYEPTLFTATTSWAAYMVGAPYNDVLGGNFRVGVSAVSKDGGKESDIAWGEWLNPMDMEPVIVEGTIIDKPIIKENEEFTVRYIDTNHPAATWEVINSFTGANIQTFDNTTSITLSLPTIGSYDIKITNPDNTVAYTRGIIQVSPDETGAIPVLSDIVVTNNNSYPEEKVTLESSVVRLGEGTVSRSEKVDDPYMLRFPEVVPSRPYTYAMWFKVDKFTHGSQGTNLIDKRNVNDEWPHNNWGDIWVTIRPEMMANREMSTTTTADRIHPANEISFNTYGWKQHDVPNSYMMSNDHSVNEGQWTHIAVTFGTDDIQKMYFNGKKVAETKIGKIESNGVRSQGSPILIGGTSVYKSGFNGWIDEFQVWDRVLTDAEIRTAMKGYTTVPAGLQGYWTFEETQLNESGMKVFPNKGEKGATYTAAYVSMEKDENNDNVEKIMDAQNGELGNPMISGSLQVSTTQEWSLPGVATSSQSGTNATVSYNAAGTYTAGLSLKNMWGSDNKVVDVVVVPFPTGLEDSEIELMGVYPNPFTDYVNLSFVKGGVYSAEILALDGKLIESKKLTVSDNEIVRIDVNGGKGIYILKIKSTEGESVRTLKVVKN